MNLTQEEQYILSMVRQGLMEDREGSPFLLGERYYLKFEKVNKDELSFRQAPIGKVLMVTSESLGTFYSKERGTSIMRGSILIKVTHEDVVLLDAYSWYGMSGNAHVFPIQGEFRSVGVLRGKVKELQNVKIPQMA